MISYDAILVFIVLLFILVSLYLEILGPAFTFVVGIIFLAVNGILQPVEVLSGFANEQIAVVIMLLVIGELIRKTGVVEVIFDRAFKNARSYKGFLSRMTSLIAVFSAFLNNTPLVAVMMPYVNTWCKRNNISPSKFLMPLSFAAILGGCATLIGTSTNLIVNGMIEKYQADFVELRKLEIFEFSAVGIPMIILGVLYLLFFGEKLLPAKANPFTEYSSQSREYIVEARVKEKSPLVGSTIKSSKLINMPGLYLVEINRDGDKISALTPDEIIEKGDVLVFAGDTDHIADMIESSSGLELQEIGMLKHRKKAEVIEVVVSQNSTLVKKNVREANFRSKYDAAIIAVHRNGERLSGRMSELALKAGDVLLLFTGEAFLDRSNDTNDFYFISTVKNFIKYDSFKVAILFGGTILAILLASLKVVPLFTGLLVVIMAAMVLEITKPKELPKSIDYNLALIIALSLALGEAMQKTGAADALANSLITVFHPLGKTIGLMIGLYLITAILAAYITTKAAVAIIFPIALTTAMNFHLDPTPFILIVAYASAATFITPIGFQTNLMVYGPGNYSFKDFFRVGLPLTLLYMVVAVLILYWIYLR